MPIPRYSFFSLTLLLFSPCGNYKNANSQYPGDGMPIVKANDASAQTSDTVRFRSPKELTPLSLLKAVVREYHKDSLINVITMVDEFPVDWVNVSDVDTLVSLITSTQKCCCLLNPFSSYIPTNKHAEIGGYAIIFINSFRQKSKINLGLYLCPYTDQDSVAEIKKWWTEYKQTK